MACQMCHTIQTHVSHRSKHRYNLATNRRLTSKCKSCDTSTGYLVIGMTPIPVTKKTGTDGRTQMHQDLDLAAERPSGEAASVAALTSRSIAAHLAATFALVRIVCLRRNNNRFKLFFRSLNDV